MCDNLSLFKCGQKIMYTYTEVGYIAKVTLFFKVDYIPFRTTCTFREKNKC